MTQELSPSGFIRALFGDYTDTPIFLCSLPNGDAVNESGERSLLTRTLEDIDAFAGKHDRKGRGLYFSVGTLRPDAMPQTEKGSRRCKANVAQIICLHADVDLKSVLASREEILEAVRVLPHPPSVIVDSGNGLHLYWLLSDTLEADLDTIAMVEGLNEQIADLVGGDSVKDVCRLMRLPGSHNTKGEAWKPVAVMEGRFEPRYEIGDIEEMLAQMSPVIRRKPSEKAPPRSDMNPFEAIAARMGFKAPTDVEARLAAMDYQGAGDTSIHHTQLACSASLLNRGVAVEDVVETLLRATQAAAGEMGARWNWTREETAIRKMCADWQRKHPDHVVRPLTRQEATAQITGEDAPRPKPRERAVARERDAPGEVVSLSEARTNRKPKPHRQNDDDPAIHIKVGSVMLEHLAETGEAILFTKKAAYHYSGGLWLMETDGLKAWLDVKLQAVAEGLGLESTNRLLSEARGWVTRRPALWRDNVAFDGHGMIPTRSGLLDPRTLDLTPARPDHYCTWRVEADYDPAATCPVWEEMIGDTFADRGSQQKADVIGVLQEAWGSGLLDVKPRGMSLALVFVGASNSGKSGLIDVLAGLYGEDHNSTSLDQLEGTHGLMGFMRRAPWVLHEAFNQAKWHTSSTVKAIITGDPVPINIKNGPILTQRIRAPIFWGTNSPPQFKETTLAVVNRLLIINCKRVFSNREAVGTARLALQQGYDRPSNLVLATERSGLLNWALTGMQRALARGAIIQTMETLGAGEEMHRDSNLAAGFIADCVEFDPDWRVSTPDFCAAFAAWYAQEKGTDRFIPSNEAIGKAVLALAPPGLAYHPVETRDKKRRYYCGIRLNEEGEAFWKRALQARAFEGKLAATTPDGDPVNTPIPESWAWRDCIQRMRLRAVTVAQIEGETSPAPMCHLSETVTAQAVTAQAVTAAVTTRPSPAQAVDFEQDPFF